MDSSIHHKNYQHHFHDTKNLTRFRSAPTSFFASLFDDSPATATGGADKDEFSNARPLSPETEDIFKTFMSKMGTDRQPNSTQKLCDIPENSTMVEVKKEESETSQGSFVNSPKPVVYQRQLKPPLANQRSSLKRGFPSNTSMGTKIARNSNLTRYCSSPAGFFANILNLLDNGFGSEVKGIGQKTQAQAHAQPPSYSGLITQKSIDSIFSENLSNFDDEEEEDEKNFSQLDSSENQRSGEVINGPTHRLTHHLSLPKKMNDISDMEKLLFEDTVVPCRIRAKRGCATHPRSIAERVRRTKISERMRKLQDLVPNMDNQTNTAEMLDLAVEYIKDLKNQITTMTDYQAKCTCLRYTYT